ncbi:MAG: hypothetical protein VW644_03605 [Alphaproteobacteria bacterium]|jgi:hypothetical protein
MVTAHDISYGLYSAWRFVRLDRGAMQFVDNSVDGFWKSFFAAVIIAPAYLLIMVVIYTRAGDALSAGFIEIVVVEATRYVMSWVAFPLVMTSISDMLQRGERYIGYVVAYNWSQVAVMAVALPVFLLIAASGTATGTPNALQTILFFAVAFYQWFIARTALSTSGWVAAGVVAAAFILEAGIETVAVSLLR